MADFGGTGNDEGIAGYPPGIRSKICSFPDHRRSIFPYNFFPDQHLKGGMSRPTPPKTAEILKYEGKSHRTKAEIRQREKGEKALLTGVNLKEKKEVENNKVAHK